jgi:poly(3-hydroxybutyrate) depolymerase
MKAKVRLMTRLHAITRVGAITQLSVALCLFLVASFATQAADATMPRKESFEVAGIKRTFWLYAPDSAGIGPSPLVVLLHGSYGDGRGIVGQWKDLAASEGFIVAGPDSRDRTEWQIRADGPAFIHQLVDAVEQRHPIDRQRLYLFGHSGGAVYALTLSMIESEFFAATAVHAGAWRSNREFIAVPYARRKIPIEIFIGDKDEFFPLQAARKTQSALRDAGHDARLTVIPKHTHDYSRVAGEVNREAWAFMKETRLAPAQAAVPARGSGEEGS